MKYLVVKEGVVINADNITLVRYVEKVGYDPICVIYTVDTSDVSVSLSGEQATAFWDAYSKDAVVA